MTRGDNVMALFRKAKVNIGKFARKKIIPDGLWTKCVDCSEIVYNKALKSNHKVCPKCNYHFALSAPERIELMLDENTFQEYDSQMQSLDPLNFQGVKSYKEKLAADAKATGLKEAAVTGEGKLDGKEIVIGITDSRFIMGSMGSVVGEKITRSVEEATKRHLPLVIVSGSGGGARMYEGMLSLMQMAKTSAAIARHHDAGFPYVSILTNPTMAGVMASFASLGDVVIAEPKALIGFTGPRVIEQTIKQQLPEGFQRSEFLLKHGLIDSIVERKDMKETVGRILDYFC